MSREENGTLRRFAELDRRGRYALAWRDLTQLFPIGAPRCWHIDLLRRDRWPHYKRDKGTAHNPSPKGRACSLL